MTIKFDMQYIPALTGIKAALRKFRHNFAVSVIAAIRFADANIANNTPVYTGRVLRNYRWAVDTVLDQAIYPALGEGIDPGPTGSMPLGVEPRRAVNRTPMQRSVEEVLPTNDPFHKYILLNPTWQSVELEAGQLPDPARNRSRGYATATVALLKAAHS